MLHELQVFVSVFAQVMSLLVIFLTPGLVLNVY